MVRCLSVHAANEFCDCDTDSRIPLPNLNRKSCPEDETLYLSVLRCSCLCSRCSCSARALLRIHCVNVLFLTASSPTASAKLAVHIQICEAGSTHSDSAL